MMLTEIIAIALWAILAYSDYKYLSISSRLYAESSIILIAVLILNFITSFKLAFISFIVGAAIYVIYSWYTKRFMTSTDRRLILLSLLAFPLPAIGGLAATTLRGTWKSKSKYYPALTYFAIGFVLISLLTLIG